MRKSRFFGTNTWDSGTPKTKKRLVVNRKSRQGFTSMDYQYIPSHNPDIEAPTYGRALLVARPFKCDAVKASAKSAAYSGVMC